MRLQITLALGAANGKSSHSIIAEVEDANLVSFRARICATDFIIVREWIKDSAQAGPDGVAPLVRGEDQIVNTALIGKVKAYTEKPPAA